MPGTQAHEPLPASSQSVHQQAAGSKAQVELQQSRHSDVGCGDLQWQPTSQPCSATFLSRVRAETGETTGDGSLNMVSDSL